MTFHPDAAPDPDSTLWSSRAHLNLTATSLVLRLMYFCKELQEVVAVPRGWRYIVGIDVQVYLVHFLRLVRLVHLVILVVCKQTTSVCWYILYLHVYKYAAV